jgi:hypothetical protein
MLTDTYGDVPYFDSNKGKEDKIFTPKFDKQKDIYLDIFKKLESADTLLNAAANVNGGSDPFLPAMHLNGANLATVCTCAYCLRRVSGKAEVSCRM